MERIDRDISMAAEWGAKHHVLVTCNEFGAYRAFSNPEDRVRWIADMRTVLERHGIGWTMWDYAGGFSVVNKDRRPPDTRYRDRESAGVGWLNGKEKCEGK